MYSHWQICDKVSATEIKPTKHYYTNNIYISGNKKESWKAINELFNKRSQSSNIDCIKEYGSVTVHQKDASIAMNNFFWSVDKDLAE